jgi:hypothetical protein
LKTQETSSVNASSTVPPESDIQQIIRSAERLGVEINEEEALQWLAAMAALSSQAGDGDQSDITLDEDSGVFGHRIVLLDFSPEDLAHFRRIGRIVGFEDQPGIVETALALSGSSAQSKIQVYPGDADYFERINIKAATRPEACQVLARLMRQKALETEKGPNYQLIEVKFGSFPEDVEVGGRPVKKGSPISWMPEEIRQGQIEARRPDGSPLNITWEAVSSDPGWCKLDWVVADPVRNQLANASNMLDVTWESPNGEIIPLDGYLDPYFQEVYLEADSIPIFSKLVKHVSADALDHYVHQLENEVRKYLAHDPRNYGKAAKRMYNIFRLTGRYEEAAFLRELFDEPAAMLYQVWSLIRTIDDCFSPGSTISIDDTLAQCDRLILAVISALEGDEETEIVRHLLRLRDALARQQASQELTAEAEAARAQVIQIVNNFFYEKLTSIPKIKAYMERVETE